MATKAISSSSAQTLFLAAALLALALAMSTSVKAQQCTSDLDRFLACGDFRDDVPAAQKAPVDRDKCCRLVNGISSEQAADCLCANFARGIRDDNNRLNFFVVTVLEVCDKDPVPNLDCSSRST